MTAFIDLTRVGTITRGINLGADYQLLVGQHFDSKGVPYVVRSVVWSDNRWVALAEPRHVDDAVRRPGLVRDFPVNYVMGRVEVEEEIVLFAPRWVSGEMAI